MSEGPVTFRDGRYRVVRVLGEGAQATTFDAVDAKLGQAVAVKRFRVRGAKSWKEVELAEREATVLAGLSHPVLPRYVEHFEEGGELFLVTEKIEGESLAALRKRGVTFGEDAVRRLLHDAADALGYLHGRAPPIVHRDLKPGNVIRRPDGSFAFIDFGAVRDRMKPEGGSTVVGTFGYMAPEQFQGRAMPASDVYAIGATALSLLTGREPEDLPHVGLGIDVQAALSESRVSPALVEALAAMLVPDPDVRARSIPALDTGREPPGEVEAFDGHPSRRARSPLALVVWAALMTLVAAWTIPRTLGGRFVPFVVCVPLCVFALRWIGGELAAEHQRGRRRRRVRIGVARPRGRRVEEVAEEEDAEEAEEDVSETRRRRPR